MSLRVLLTGGAGCIGTHLARKLVLDHLGNSVFVFDKLDYCSSTKGLEDLEQLPNFRFIRGDITSSDFVNYIFKEHKINVVLHLAAQTHVDNSFGDSLEFTKNNIYGTHVLLEAARQHKVSKFIHVSTDEVYGEVSHDTMDYAEESLLAPTNPYAATKAAAEMLVLAYHKSFKLPVIISRSNNVYGPYQYPEKVIPKFLCSLIKGLPCYVHGNGSNSRRYLYVTDVVDALITVLNKGQIGEIYNIGTNFEISNLELAKLLVNKMNLKSQLEEKIEFVEDRAFNDLRYAIDSSKLEALGWRPKVDWESGIQQTIDWYKNYMDTYWSNDIQSVLTPHPVRKVPPIYTNHSSSN